MNLVTYQTGPHGQKVQRVLVEQGLKIKRELYLGLVLDRSTERPVIMIDVISPCVTFNDHAGSTKSYAYAKEHDDAVGEISFVPYFEDISVEYDAGTTTEVTLHDGSRLFLKKVAEDYNPTDRLAAVRLLHETRLRGEFATGVLFVEPDKDDFIAMLNLVDAPLASLPLEMVRPGQDVLDEVMEDHR